MGLVMGLKALFFFSRKEREAEGFIFFINFSAGFRGPYDGGAL